jgi:hypothetical protein
MGPNVFNFTVCYAVVAFRDTSTSTSPFSIPWYVLYRKIGDADLFSNFKLFFEKISNAGLAVHSRVRSQIAAPRVR